MEKNKAFYNTFKYLLGSVFLIYYRPKFRNKNVIPERGPIILCGNHIHLYDQCLPILSTKRMLHYMAKKEYFDTIFNSDCLISDASSFIADYFMTGKPIIYCHKTDMFNELSRKMSEGFYWAKNWEEVEKILNNLKTGKDELKEKRLQILRDLNVNNQNAGKMIADILKYNNSTTKKM